MTDISWKKAVLEIIQQRKGGKIKLQEIYKEVLLLPLATESHKKLWTIGGQPRYQCWIRRVLTDLVRDGSVNRPKRGVYKAN